MKVLCWTCKHRRSIPGNAHIRCGARVPDAALKANPILELATLIGGLSWANFDPNFPRPITQCELHIDEVTT